MIFPRVGKFVFLGGDFFVVFLRKTGNLDFPRVENCVSLFLGMVL